MNTKMRTPWRADGRAIRAEIDGYEVLIAEVACMPCIGGHDDIAAERGSDLEAALAPFIVTACNSYESDQAKINALATTLKALARVASESVELSDWPELQSALDDANETLALAGTP